MDNPKDIINNPLNSEQKEIVPIAIAELQKLVAQPTTLGILEFATGVSATIFNNPGDLVKSGGKLAQAIVSKKFLHQLYTEIHSYRDAGKIDEEKINSTQGQTIFVELLKAIDEENLDEKKYEALKNIFFKSVLPNTDEHTQMLAYQYFLICKKLSSFDIILMKAAFEVYLIPYSNKGGGGIQDWEVRMSSAIKVPRELITQSRLENSAVGETKKTFIFDPDMGTTKHGLTELGVEVAKFLVE
jgi:hypothetical protein